jgi:hypothetical protein
MPRRGVVALLVQFCGRRVSRGGSDKTLLSDAAARDSGPERKPKPFTHAAIAQQ